MANDKFYESIGAEAGNRVSTMFFKSKLKIDDEKDTYLMHFVVPTQATSFEIIKEGG